MESYPSDACSPQPRPDPFARVLARLHSTGGLRERFLRGHARNKLRLDAVYRAALAVIPPERTVLDLGCGLGLLGMLLEAQGQGNPTIGIEWDGAKVQLARRLMGPQAASRVIQDDLLMGDWPDCSVVVLLDVLHYLWPDQQRVLLFRIASHLPEGGRLLLRVMDAEAGGVAALTRFWEQSAVLLGWNRAPRVHWRSLNAVRRDVMDAGFTLVPQGGQPAPVLGNCLLLGEKSRTHPRWTRALADDEAPVHPGGGRGLPAGAPAGLPGRSLVDTHPPRN